MLLICSAVQVAVGKPVSPVGTHIHAVTERGCLGVPEPPDCKGLAEALASNTEVLKIQ